MPPPIVLPMARWFIVTSVVASILLVSAGVYGALWGPSVVHRTVGLGLAILGAFSVLDAFISRIVLDADEIRLISLVRTRRYPRSDFESAKAEAGGVALKRRDGGWLVLPATGHNALSVRNTVHAWVKRGQKETGGGS